MSGGGLLWRQGLTPELEEKARKELGETSQVREDCLKQLKNLIEADHDFKPCIEDGFLLRFLRYKKFDVARAFKTLKSYYGYRARFSGQPGQQLDVTVNDVDWLLQMDKVIHSPIRDPSGCAVIIFRAGTYDIDLAPMECLQVLGWLLADISLHLEATQVCGARVVVDMQGFTLRRLARFFRPVFIIDTMSVLIDTMPYRMKGLHILNESKYFKIMYTTLISPLLPKKVRDRVVFHGNDLKSLCKFFPPECLTKEMSGSLDQKQIEEFKSEILKRNHLSEKLRHYVFKGKTYPVPLQKMWTKNYV